MDKETFRKTNNKFKTIKQVLWEELRRVTKQHNDTLIVIHITDMINAVDSLEVEFGDYCEPSKRKK